MMAGIKKMVLFLLITVLSPAVRCISPVSPPIKAAYWPSWMHSSLPVSMIDTSFFTHLYYAFLQPDPISFRLVISESEDHILANFSTTLHRQNRPVKVVLSIGGGGASPGTFAKMVANASSRQSFINSAIAIGRKYGFDGLDLDWEFPATPEEMNNLGQLLREWRLALVQESQAMRRQRLLLSSAVYFAVDFFSDLVSRSYPVASMRDNLDWANAMCFDYHGPWDKTVTGAHSALFDPKTNLSTSFGLNSWIRAGMPPNKLVMGLPLYGHTWQLLDPQFHAIGSPAVDVGLGNGLLSFAELGDFNTKNNATVVYDEVTVSTYSYAGNSWIGYDDATSITGKILFARAHRLGGHFFWAVTGDKDWKISRQASKAWGK